MASCHRHWSSCCIAVDVRLVEAQRGLKVSSRVSPVCSTTAAHTPVLPQQPSKPPGDHQTVKAESHRMMSLRFSSFPTSGQCLAQRHFSTWTVGARILPANPQAISLQPVQPTEYHRIVSNHHTQSQNSQTTFTLRDIDIAKAFCLFVWCCFFLLKFCLANHCYGCQGRAVDMDFIPTGVFQCGFSTLACVHKWQLLALWALREAISLLMCTSMTQDFATTWRGCMLM